MKTVAVLLVFAAAALPGSLSGSEGISRATVMSLNIYGHATMPGAAPAYAALVEKHSVDVLAIQEGVWDWEIDDRMPTDYSRSETLHQALGDCWQRRYQVFVNHCKGFSIQQHERFDLADGPRATRTGEFAVIDGPPGRFALINVHWDHESATARAESVLQTARAAQTGLPVVVLGDFNAPCQGEQVERLAVTGGLERIVDGGIDCILVRRMGAEGNRLEAAPSDHPAVLARIDPRD